MKYYALLTVDLNGVTQTKRDKYYEILKEEKWNKIGTTTTWKCSFKDDLPKDECINVIKNDLNKAKKNAGITNVEYAFQLGTDAVTTGK